MSNKASKKISSAFDDCLQIIEKHNVQLEDCLKMHPQFEQELTELLNLKKALKELKDINPSEKFYKNAHKRITHRLVDRPVTFFTCLRHIFTRKPYKTNRNFRMAQFFVTLILLFSLLTGGVFAADGAGPGDLLYGLNRAIDQVSLIFESDSEIEASKRLEFAAKRLEEAKNEIENGNLDNALIAFEAYDHEIDQYAKRLASKDGLDRAELEKLLAETLNIHLDVLSTILYNVPPEAHEAILKAIEASSALIDLPSGPPADIVPGPPMGDPPVPPIDVPPSPPENIPSDPPVELPTGPPVEVPPSPPMETPENPGNGMP